MHHNNTSSALVDNNRQRDLSKQFLIPLTHFFYMDHVSSQQIGERFVDSNVMKNQLGFVHEENWIYVNNRNRKEFFTLWRFFDNWFRFCEMSLLQGLSVPFACVGSGDPVRVLRLYTTNTLDIFEAFIAETYVQLVATGSNVLRGQALRSETSYC